MPRPADFFRNAMDPKNSPLYPKQFFQENGDEWIIRNEYGEVTNRMPRKVKPESVDIGQAGGAKRRVFYPPYSPPGGVVGQAGPGMGGYVPSKIGEPVSEMPGVEIEPPKGETAAQAGPMQNYQGGLEDAQKIVGAFLKPDGTVDQKLVFQTWGNVPKTQGRNMLSMWKNAVDAIVRSRTGAAVQDREWSQYMTIYLPGPLDDQATQKEKLNRLVRDLSGTLAKIDPSGVQQSRTGQPGGVAEVEAPPASELKEGFARPIRSPSGEMGYWTLEGGKPKRVK
jgi:hypothetical protein